MASKKALEHGTLTIKPAQPLTVKLWSDVDGNAASSHTRDSVAPCNMASFRGFFRQEQASGPNGIVQRKCVDR